MRKFRMSIIAALGSIIAGLVNTSCRISAEGLYGCPPDLDRNDTISQSAEYGCPVDDGIVTPPLLYGPRPTEKD